jgi:hypothetical protein
VTAINVAVIAIVDKLYRAINNSNSQNHWLIQLACKLPAEEFVPLKMKNTRS